MFCRRLRAWLVQGLPVICAGVATLLAPNLATAQEKVTVPTFTPDGYTAILDGAYRTGEASLVGRLFLPVERAAPVPAVVVMHGSGGVRDDTEIAVAKTLRDAGIAALVVDSFGGRGLSETGTDQGKLPMAASVLDGFQAFLALRPRPEIDAARIGIVGFSRGGVAALFSNQEPLRAAVLAEVDGFAAHVSVYPGCSTQWDTVAPTASPVLILLGDEDDLTPASKCRVYADRIAAAGGGANTVVYPGVSHQFLVTRKKKIGSIANFADCDMGITDAGEMHYPTLGIAVGDDWPGFVRTVFKDCGKRGFTQGGTSASRKHAIADIVTFFKKNL